jgi:Zn-dependent metalloprotease
MNRPRTRWLAAFASLAILSSAAVSCGGVPGAVSVAALTQESQAPVAATHNPRTGRASFVRGRIPVTVYGLRAADTSSAVAYGFMRRYAALFGTDSGGRDLQYVDSRRDALGMRHMIMKQVYQGVEVYAATVSVHLAREGGMVVAVSSNAVPDVRVPTTQPTISEDSARAIAATQLLHGTVVSSRLVVYPGQRRASDAALAWMVEARGFERDSVPARRDSIPARKEYAVDAGHGNILDVLDRLYTTRNRMTYDANHGTALPGTLRRTEAAGPVGDADVDSAHAFVGATYDYYAATHGRDSYDGAGATLTSSVHYSTNYQNAFWDGSQMVFGDGFAVKDVTAHELTHAVTERTANLEYRWQSGALNESFSDIFGAMVDRDDWLMGEDLSIGAIRDLANPERFGQPGNMSAWVKTCSDNEGVHTNSGIFSKAFVNIATAIGKGDAERIFYRALTTPGYLQPQSTMEDARAAALQSAADLFGLSSAQEQAVNTGFSAVGLDGSFQPPANSCGVPDLSLWGFVALAVLLGVAAVLRRRTRSARA